MNTHVVVAGGGIGALEGLLALQALAGDCVRVSVVTPGPRLTYRALSVAEPFGAGPAPRFAWQEIARDRGVDWIPDSVTGVRPAQREVVTHDGRTLPYDALLLALGARTVHALPGALVFAGPRDVVSFMEALESLTPTRPHSIVFAAVTTTTWMLPLYELALLTAAFGRRHGLDLSIELVTSEPEPLAAFGRDLGAEVRRELEAGGVAVRTGALGSDAAVPSAPGTISGADLVVALPQLAGPRLPGLPCDDEGFVPVDDYCRARGVERVWAVGDMTRRRLKHGGLAAQQADVAAADIAASIAGADVDPRPYAPVLEGKLLTGGEPLLLERSGAPSGARASVFLWWPAHKVAGRHLSPYLHRLGREALRR